MNVLQEIRKIIVKFIKERKIRIAAGILFLAAELFFFFGTDALLEEVHFLTGEGLWDVTLTEEIPSVCQEFVPAHRSLRSVSFRMDLTEVTKWDGTVVVSVQDEDYQVLFEESRPYYAITDCAYTDVEVNLKLSPRRHYYLTIYCTPSSAGEYPKISVCGREYELPESRSLSYGEEQPGQHLVSRYSYADALTFPRAAMAAALCLLAAAGVIFGLPGHPYARRAAAAFLLLAAPVTLGWRLETLVCDLNFYLPFAMKWNIGLMVALELLVLLATHSPRVSIVLSNTAVTALYSANYFMRQYRGTSLRMNDFTAVGTATKVMGAYDLSPDSELAFIWGILIVFVVFGLQTKAAGTDRHKNGVKLAISYSVTSVLTVAAVLWGGYQLLYTDMLARAGFEGRDIVGFDYELIYSFDGYLVGTCIEIQNSRIVKPEGYSVELVEQILTEAAALEDQTGESQVQPNDSAADRSKLPHVIVVMNESLADIRVAGDVELSQENLGFMKSLRENTINGWVNASTFGGGTANSEFELLTGCSMAFLSVNYYPYQQALNKPVNSMVSRMKENGYTAISMHPESAGNWNRRNVYRYYGFDTMLWKQDFEGEEIVHSGVSDAATYRRIIELYENREPGEKLFVFDVTMQNHGGYTEDEAPYAVTALNLQEEQIDQYLSLVKISDDAFAGLVHYFEEQDEKVVICMFGDHQPWIFDLIAGTVPAEGSGSSGEVMNKYKTPFVIWANYDIEEARDLDISMNYLGGLLMRTAGIPLSPYFRFLEQEREQYPIVTVNGYVDSAGEYFGWGSEEDEFSGYKMLQYNYLFDDEKVDWGY